MAYDQHLAAIYDYLYAISQPEIDRMASTLRRVSPGNELFEFGVGSGRIALPLAASGFSVTGTDTSAPMLERLADKDPEGTVAACDRDFIRGSFSGTDYVSEFDAVLLLCNTVFAAHDLADQHAIFANARSLIRDDGVFVIETFNPLNYLAGDFRPMAYRSLTDTIVLMEQIHVNRLTQMLRSHHLVFDEQDLAFQYTDVLRLMTPLEMDAIADSEGFALSERLAEWGTAPAIDTSPRLISIYEEQ